MFINVLFPLLSLTKIIFIVIYRLDTCNFERQRDIDVHSVELLTQWLQQPHLVQNVRRKL